jgi:hypothetical protein
MFDFVSNLVFIIEYREFKTLQVCRSAGHTLIPEHNDLAVCYCSTQLAGLCVSYDA